MKLIIFSFLFSVHAYYSPPLAPAYRSWPLETSSEPIELAQVSSRGSSQPLVPRSWQAQVSDEFKMLQLINRLNESALLEGDFILPLWETIKFEASVLGENDAKASTLMENAIFSQHSLKDAIIDMVSNQLESPLLPATQIRNLFCDVCEKDSNLLSTLALDILASVLRDNSQPNAVSVLLFNQGFHALAAYRFANALWLEGRDGLGRYFQSLISRKFGADIHPACRIGHSCIMTSGTGIVIGETAVIGTDCSVSHGVTLGGTGKESGDRHPKIGNGVFLAAGATILGNIKVGDGAVVNAGSVVTKRVAPFTRVGGVPAILISRFAVDSDCVSDLAQDRPTSADNYFSYINIDYQGLDGIGT